MGQYPFNTKRPLPLATRYKLIYMPKQSQRILVSPLYNFPLHREAGNLNQAQTSAINCVCEFRFSSQNIFVLINENAAKTVSYLFLATTIMDKSPWDSQNVTSILCVSQVLSQKAVLSFYKSMSPPPSPPNTMLKDQRNCALTVSTLSGGRGQGRTVLVARGYNFACVKRRSNCTTVPRLLSMIVGAS